MAENTKRFVLPRLIKAEFFRSTRSGIYVLLLALSGLASAFSLLLSTNTGRLDFGSNLGEIIQTFSGGNSMMTIILVSMMISLLVGNIYMHRIYYYEIMDGAGVHSIIVSKLISAYALTGICVILPISAVFAAMYIKNGAGDVHSFGLFCLLAIVVILNTVTFMTLFTMLLKNMILGTVCSYLLIMFQAFIELMVMNIKDMKLAQMILYLFPMFQMQGLAGMDYSGRFIAQVLLSFAGMFILMYALVWFTYKKKLFR